MREDDKENDNGHEEISTDDTIGHGDGDITGRTTTTATTTASKGEMKKGVPECMKAKFRSNSPRQVRKGSVADTSSSRTRRFSVPTAPSNVYAMSTTHIPPARRNRSATPTQEKEPAVVVTSARRRSLTPTLTRSTTATMEPPSHKSGTWGSPKKKKVSKAITRSSNPKPTPKAALRDSSPDREKDATPSAKRTPVTVVKTTRTPSPAPSAEKSLLMDMASPRSSSTQVHKAAKRPSASTTLTFSRPKPFSSSAAMELAQLSTHPNPPAAATNVVPSPTSRRSVTMTQSQPMRKGSKSKPTFVTSLPLPARNARFTSTTVFDLDQVWFLFYGIIRKHLFPLVRSVINHLCFLTTVKTKLNLLTYLVL